ncbi:hypothetical protein K8R66_04670, partial [bacterium]|nr:hypothetical protein [bacterium]
YSSFGIGKINFSKDLLLDALTNKTTIYLLTSIIESYTKGSDIEISRNLIGSDAREFILKHNLLQFTDQLRLDNDGNTNYESFKLNNFSIDSDIEIHLFFSKFDNEYAEYEKETFTSIIKKIEQSAENQTAHNKSLINNIIIDKLENFSDEAFPYLISFFKYLIQEDSKYSTSEELTLDILNLGNVYSKVNEFYEEKLGIKSERRKMNELDLSIKNKQDFIKTLEEDPETEKGDLQKQVGELQKLEKNYEFLKKQIHKNEQNISDPKFRRNLLQKENDEWTDRNTKNRERIEQHEKIIKQKKLLHENLLAKKEQFLKRFTLIYPAILVVVLIGFYYIFFKYVDNPAHLIANLNLNKISFIIYTSVIFLLAYLIYAYILYNKKIWIPLKLCREELKLLYRKKIENLFLLIDTTNKIFLNEFEHRICSLALENVRKLKFYIKKCAEGIEDFKTRLELIHEKHSKSYNQFLDSTSSINQNEIVNSNLIDYYFNENQHKTDLFYTKGLSSIHNNNEIKIGGKSISHYLIEFLSDQTSGINNLEEEIQKYCLVIYKFLKESDIYKMLFKNTEVFSSDDINSKIKILLDTSESLIKLSNSSVNDISYSFSNIYIENNEQIRNLIKQILKDLSDNEYTFINGNKNEVIRVNLKLGFPAFALANLTDYSKSLDELVNKKNGIKKSNFYSNPDLANYNLFPVELEDNTITTDRTKIAVLALALELVKYQNNFIISENKSFDSAEKFADFFYKTEGKKQKDQLYEKIEKIRAQAQQDESVRDMITIKLQDIIKNGEFENYNDILVEFIHSIGEF